MIGDVGVQIAIVAPLAAAAIALAFNEERGAKTYPALMLALGAAAAAVGGFEHALGRSAEWRGFEGNGFRALLVAGSTLYAAASMLRVRTSFARGAACVAAGLVAASLFSPNTLWLGLTLVASTIALGVSLFCERAPSTALLPVAFSDLLVLSGLLWAAHGSSSFRTLAGAGMWLILAGGVVRVLSPRSDRWLVPTFGVRAQGVLLCLFAIAGSAHRANVLLIVAAAGCGMIGFLVKQAGVRTLPALLVLTGFGIGGASGFWGATVAIIVLFSAMLLESVPAFEALPALLSFAPALGSFVAASLVVGGVVRLGVAKPWYIFAALPVFVAVLSSTQRGWLQHGPRSSTRARTLTAVTVVPAFAVLGLLAFVPKLARLHGLIPLSRNVGIGVPLARINEMPTAEVGLIVGVLAVLGFLFGRVREREGGAIPREIEAYEVVTTGTKLRVHASLVPLAMVSAVSVILAAVLFLSAGGRGWL